jgi:hypothetical protein
MNEVTELRIDPGAPAGYRLGDPIPLEDLLALPPDGRRYTRDAGGRLALMLPDDARWHGFPESSLVRWFYRRLADPSFVTSERAIAFARISSLQGRLVPPSRLGPKVLEPDVAVFAEPPGFVVDDRGQARGLDPSLLRLVVEVLSPGTHRQDLGLGDADAVDRLRTYLDSGVPELWMLNPGPRALGGLPPRSALFLRAAAGAWEALPGDALVEAAPTSHGFRPVLSGRCSSAALGFTVDVDELWTAVLPKT